MLLPRRPLQVLATAAVALNPSSRTSPRCQPRRPVPARMGRVLLPRAARAHAGPDARPGGGDGALSRGLVPHARARHRDRSSPPRSSSRSRGGGWRRRHARCLAGAARRRRGRLAAAYLALRYATLGALTAPAAPVRVVPLAVLPPQAPFMTPMFGPALDGRARSSWIASTAASPSSRSTSAGRDDAAARLTVAAVVLGLVGLVRAPARRAATAAPRSLAVVLVVGRGRLRPRHARRGLPVAGRRDGDPVMTGRYLLPLITIYGARHRARRLVAPAPPRGGGRRRRARRAGLLQLRRMGILVERFYA